MIALRSDEAIAYSGDTVGLDSHFYILLWLTMQVGKKAGL